MPKTPIHAGIYVREKVIPIGMSVTRAAQRLGVSRSALSNFLNGNSSLSPEMAVRLEKTFGADQEQLLGIQSAHDQHKRYAAEKEVEVRTFVPSFLIIKARQIEDWASQIDTRSLLPVLLRKLVHSTGIDLRRVDFPGYDNAQRKGYDGFVSAGSATPWIPKGISYWEFGTDQRPGRKADDDYAARLPSDPSERASSTFVFVTPRNWPGKVEWERQKNKLGDWKAVRAFDASDLEQWLEQSVPAQIWLAEQLALPADGYETLEEVWRRWAFASTPHLTPEIFGPSIAAYRETFTAWLKKPSERPFVIAADSRDEALAFLYCLFDDEELRQFGDLAAVFTSPITLRRLLISSVPFIPIVHSEDVERELGDAYRRLHCIVFCPRNAVDKKADIALDLLNYDAFRTTLKSMGVDENDIERLARESGRSPTILRRRLSENAAIKTPGWASDNGTAKALVPLALIGTWHVESEADRKVISSAAERKYDAIENDIARLLRLDDSPVWSAGRYRGVVSKIDALFAIAGMVTEADLARFFYTAEYVLSESDPTLDLPEEKRWAAVIYGKKREHSGALRDGICETLVILSVHGNELFQKRLGIDVEGRVTLLIGKLLTPFTLEKILSQNRELPHYAEAAPEQFLNIIEQDLRGDAPIVLTLLRPAETNSFLSGSPPRTGLLWALECLAWKPKHLARVSMILAQLSQQRINDNWGNKPAASLQAIFRSWMPQTAASVEERIRTLELLMKRYPDVAWDICSMEIKPGSRIGSYSYKPRWRSDASGAGKPVLRKDIFDFNRKSLDLMISWSSHDEKTLSDLVEFFRWIPTEDQTKVWDLIDEWSRDATEYAKAALRERIRRSIFSRQTVRGLGEETRAQAHKAYSSLRPQNPVLRHGWLFADYWIQELADEIIEGDLVHQKHEERIDGLRRNAMFEIWGELGFEGVKGLIAADNNMGIVGRYMVACLPTTRQRADFVQSCLSLDGIFMSKANWCLQGFLWAIEHDLRAEVLKVTSAELSPDDRKRLLLCAPFQASTWRLLDELGEDVGAEYWKEAIPWGQHSSADLQEIIDRLLETRRPHVAFDAVRLCFEEVETSRLKRLLRDVATVRVEPSYQFKLAPYDISKALDSLDGRAGITRDEMAQLEFIYIEALQDTEHGIPNLEDQIAQSPQLFAHAVALVYKRSDDGIDPPELLFESPEQQAAAGSRAYHLLHQMKRIPGTDSEGMVDTAALAVWLAEVRRLCQENARANVGDICIGNLLARAREGANGEWPCRAVCEAMEEIASPQIGSGFFTEVRNSRGVYQHGEGGEQERELAAKYHTKADRLRYEFPYVAEVIETIAKSYEQQAQWEDLETSIEKRLRYGW